MNTLTKLFCGSRSWLAFTPARPIVLHSEYRDFRYTTLVYQGQKHYISIRMQLSAALLNFGIRRDADYDEIFCTISRFFAMSLQMLNNYYQKSLLTKAEEASMRMLFVSFNIGAPK